MLVYTIWHGRICMWSSSMVNHWRSGVALNHALHMDWRSSFDFSCNAFLLHILVKIDSNGHDDATKVSVIIGLGNDLIPGEPEVKPFPQPTDEPWWNCWAYSWYKTVSVKKVYPRYHLRLTTMLCEGPVDSVSPIPAMVSGGSQWALRGQNNVLFLSSGGRSSLRVYTDLAHVKLYIGQGKAKGASIKTR